MIIRKAGMADTEAYLRLLHEVKNGMAHSEWFFLDPDEKVRDMMEEGSMELWVRMQESWPVRSASSIPA